MYKQYVCMMSRDKKILNGGDSKMLLEEFDLEEVKAYWQKEAAEEAAAKARKETSDRVGKLFNLLLTQEKYDEAQKAARDLEYMMKLFETYGI